MKSENINELVAALAKAQAEIEPAKKDITNTFFKSKYADLASVWESVRGPLTRNGLAVSQLLDESAGTPLLHTYLFHTSGQFLKSTILVRSTKPDAQGFGAGLTYARRQGLTAMISVAVEDDDGNYASSKPIPQKAMVSTKPIEKPSGLVKVKTAEIGKYATKNLYDIDRAELTQYLIGSVQPHLNKLTEEGKVVPREWDELVEQLKGVINDK
jgi:hypothetical protein